MSSRSRALLAAGVIAVLSPFALVRSTLPAPTGGALPQTVITPAPATSSPTTPTDGAVAEAAATSPANESALRDLLHAGRLPELLRLSASLPAGETRDLWLDACARLAPPALMADHALRFETGARRQNLLDIATERWVLEDPSAFGEWAARRLADEDDLDRSLARIVEHTDGLQRPTAVALSWANLIHDPELRLRALRSAVREWAAADPAAALGYAETAPDLSPAQRAALLALFAPPVVET